MSERQRNAKHYVFPPMLEGMRQDIPEQTLNPTQASYLSNWYVDERGLRQRPGRRVVRSGGGISPRTLLNLETADATGQLWSLEQKKLQRLRTVSSASVSVVASVSALGLQSNTYSWHTVVSDGFGWAVPRNVGRPLRIGTDSTVSAPAWTTAATASNSADPTQFVGVHIFKSRGYWWRQSGAQNSLAFWYGAQANTTALDVEKFDLQYVARRGGYIMSINSWSQDGGDGPDDYLVITTSAGEVLIYQGSAPDQADWALVGVYQIPRPIDMNCFVSRAGKLIVATEQDYITLPDDLADRIRPPSPLGPDLQKVARQVGFSTPGAGHVPRGRYLVESDLLWFSYPLTLPSFSGTAVQTHIIDAQNRHFIYTFPGDLNKISDVVEFEGVPYVASYGQTGLTQLLDSQYVDDTATADQPITMVSRGGWNSLGTLEEKHILGARPAFFLGSSIESRGSVSAKLDIHMDYDQASAAIPLDLPIWPSRRRIEELFGVSRTGHTTQVYLRVVSNNVSAPLYFAGLTLYYTTGDDEFDSNP